MPQMNASFHRQSTQRRAEQSSLPSLETNQVQGRLSLRQQRQQQLPRTVEILL